MYAAITQNGTLVYASDILDDRNVQWRCPKCHQPVQLIIPQKGRRYFRHKVKDSSNYKGETDTHSEIKHHLVEYFNSHGIRVESEYYLPAIDRIADVLLIDHQLVIEIQHTPISAMNIRQRTLSYQQIGYQCIWLLTPKLETLSINHYWQVALLQYHPQLGYYRVIYKLHTKQIILQWQLELVNVESLTYYEFRGDLSVLVKLSIKSIYKKSHKISKNIASKKINYIKQVSRLKKSYANSNLLQTLYSQGYALDSLPQWIFTKRIHLRGMRTPSWMVLAWIWLYLQTLENAEEAVLQLFENNQILKYDMPFVSTAQWQNDLTSAIVKLFKQSE